MTDQNSEFQQSAAGTPEPPYRGWASQFQPQSQSQIQPQPQSQAQSRIQTQPQTLEQPVVATSPIAQADVSGIDVPGEVTQTSQIASMTSESQTESFAAARRGDTATMPQTVPPLESGYASQPRVPAEQAGTYTAAPAAQQAASAYSQQPRQAYSQAQRPANQQPSVTQTPARQKKQSSGAGKTFLFGFLGALVACALALGGFAFAGGFGGSGSPVTGNSAVIGSANQSVINAADEGQTLAEAVAAKVLPSVVAIYNYQNQSNSYGFGFGYGYGSGNQGDGSLVATGMGSGVVISDEGYIITNYHVVEDAAKLTVSINGVERDATYVGGDSSSDIAVIKVEDTEGLVSADIGDSDSLRIGEWVMTVGAPLGLESSVATGIVSATNRSQIMSSSSNANDLYSYIYGNQAPEYTYYPNMIQTDAVINPGNSGGALVDADGKLIGINAMISSMSGDYAGVGFAIPVNYAISLAKDVIDGKEPTHAMLGVSLSQVNSQIAQQYNLSAESGAYISAISEGTGAADSDLKIGDIITKIDGKAMASPTDVTLAIRAHKVGDTVSVTVNRDGEEMNIDVKLGSDENAASSSKQDEKQDQQQEQGMGQEQQGEGQGDGGYSREDIEELLKMLGM